MLVCVNALRADIQFSQTTLNQTANTLLCTSICKIIEYQFSNLGAGLASGCVSVYSFPNNLPRQGIMQGMNLRPPTGIKEI